MAEVIPEGSEVEVVKASKGLDVGDRFVIADYVSADDTEGGVAFYWGNRDGGWNNVTAPADTVEARRTAAELAARRAPSLKALASAIARSIPVSDLRIDETTITKGPGGEEDTVEMRGTTDAGLPFYAEVRVLLSHEDDL